MAYSELKFFSPSLRKATAAEIILPEGDFPGPFATMYLLHGLSDDNTIWQRKTSIERYVQNLPLIVVMPDGGRGFYTDAVEGMAWESAIMKDLIRFVDSRLNTKANREGRCIGGLSMGGYGALKLALKHPHMFCSAVSHSGAIGFAHRLSPEWDDYAEWKRVYGERPAGGNDDVYAIAKRLPKEQRPAIRVDCGTEDHLIEDNREFQAHLNAIGYPHEYQEFPGGHDWAYWDLHVQEAIAFHAKNLGLSGIG